MTFFLCFWKKEENAKPPIDGTVLSTRAPINSQLLYVGIGSTSWLALFGKLHATSKGYHVNGNIRQQGCK